MTMCTPTADSMKVVGSHVGNEMSFLYSSITIGLFFHKGSLQHKAGGAATEDIYKASGQNRNCFSLVVHEDIKDSLVLAANVLTRVK